MTTHIILTIVLILLSVKSIAFLKTYIALLQSGIKANGNVIAYEDSRHIMTKNAVIPKVEFQTEENQSVIGEPIYSWFLELNNYQLNENCTAFYDKSNSKKFVIKSNIELLTNIAITIGTLVSL